MNIITAPLALLFEPSGGGGLYANFAPGAPPGEETTAKLFFKVGVLITLLLMGVGIYLLLGGHVSGDLEAKFKDYDIKTGNAGIALVVLGVLLYLGIGSIIVKKAK